MHRLGRADGDLPDSVFDVYGEGEIAHWDMVPMLNANTREVGVVNDNNLHAYEVGGVCGSHQGMTNATQPQTVQNFVAEGFEPGRRPTPWWEYGNLGLGQSRSRMLDPEPSAALAQHQISFRPFNMEPATRFWPEAITQEVYAQYNAGYGELWGERE